MTAAVDGLQPRCKACHKARDKGRVRWTPESLRESRKRRLARDPDYERRRAALDPDRYKRHYAANRAKKRAYSAAWAKKNAARVAAYEAGRRATKLRATPRWLTDEDNEVIRFLYEEAAALQRHTGVEFHVDHIVPLRGKTVCGLHVPWNLRVISADRNRRKHNALLLDEMHDTVTGKLARSVPESFRAPSPR